MKIKACFLMLFHHSIIDSQFKKIPFPTLYLGVATLPRKSSKEKIAKEESTVSDMATLPRRSSRENSEKDSSPITVRSNSQPSNWSPPTSVKGTNHQYCES